MQKKNTKNKQTNKQKENKRMTTTTAESSKVGGKMSFSCRLRKMQLIQPYKRPFNFA